MEAEDVINLPASSNSGSGGQENEHRDSGNGLDEVNSLDVNRENKERNLDMEEDMDLTEDDFRTVHGQFSGATMIEQVSDIVSDSDALHVGVETVTVVDEKLDTQNERLIRSTTMDVSSKSGAKRPRTTSDEQQPTVHATYNHLTRASKQKLEQLLQQWSEWEAEHRSLIQDQEQVLESGEETYFPALRVGLEKTSSVSFWIDNQTGNKPLKGFIPVESSTAPLYDRGFAIGLTSADGSNNLEGGLEILDDPPRCFNCGSYSHSLRECPKPRDRSAVSNARKQHKAKRNQTPGSRLPSRYYQSSQGGKYDGLKAGTLAPETRKLLGLGESDPPPWLNRMREIGYPPGYLAPDDDHPSGITIFGEDEDIKEETEEGEILEKESPPEPPPKKMTVEFPGINAPIPENADERLWAPASSNPDAYRTPRWQHRSSRGHLLHDQRPLRDNRDDGPPGVEPSSYPPRYGTGGLNYGYGPRDHISRPRSPTFERSQSERGKRYYSSYDHDFWDRDDRDSYGFSSRR